MLKGGPIKIEKSPIIRTINAPAILEFRHLAKLVRSRYKLPSRKSINSIVYIKHQSIYTFLYIESAFLPSVFHSKVDKQFPKGATTCKRNSVWRELEARVRERRFNFYKYEWKGRTA